MENQLDSGFRGMVLQVPSHHCMILLTAEIDAYEGQYIMVMDVLSIFIQTNVPPNKYGE